MKRILIFIGLKIVEIGGVVAIIVLPCKISMFLCRWEWWREEAVFLGSVDYMSTVPKGLYWVTGMLFLSVPIAIFIGVYLFCKLNWEKAGELSK